MIALRILAGLTLGVGLIVFLLLPTRKRRG